MRGIETAAVSLCVEDLVGTWVGVRTQWPAPVEPGTGYMHFTADGRHYWEYPFMDCPALWEFRYAITVDGLRLRNGLYQLDFNAWRERDRLLLLSHGYATWYRRISAGERPQFLRLFFDAM